MNIRTAAAVLALAVLCWIPAPAASTLMPIDEIKVGMVGVGRTVFEGTDLQEFKAHILGVLRNVQGPRRDLILARLEGGPLAKTGVAAGMSGSPVYIDGRLIGAVSYSIGSFPTEAIAGITPIAEMKDATQMARRPVSKQARIDLPVTRESLTAALRAAYASVSPFANRPADVQAMGLPAAAGAQLGALLRPISTPLVLSGFEPESADLLGSAFGAAGFTPVIGGGGGQLGAAERNKMTGPLREGDAIGVSLV
ncbi:MAG: SpoIVB peptidase S55 domain-containing protein, partial [Acidobacteriota bacterium]